MVSLGLGRFIHYASVMANMSLDIFQIDEGWWRGYCRGQYGLFPANYVQLQQWWACAQRSIVQLWYKVLRSFQERSLLIGMTKEIFKNVISFIWCCTCNSSSQVSCVSWLVKNSHSGQEYSWPWMVKVLLWFWQVWDWQTSISVLFLNFLIYFQFSLVTVLQSQSEP